MIVLNMLNMNNVECLRCAQCLAKQMLVQLHSAIKQNSIVIITVTPILFSYIQYFWLEWLWWCEKK